LCVPVQKDRIRKMMTGDMLRGDRVPAVVFDYNPSLVAYWLESNFYVGELSGCERFLTPGKGEAQRWLPRGYAADFKALAIRQNFNQTSIRPRLELELAG
jgi:hypothetical protein